MKVADLMTRKLITVSPEDSVEVAVQMLRQRGVRHLLVVKSGELVGIVSDRDIKRALDPQRTKKRLLGIGGLYFLIEPILVREIMTRNVVTIAPDLTVQEAAAIMVGRRFGALPVVEDVADTPELVGIITETDLLRYFATSASDQQSKAKKSRQPRRRPQGK
jgi:acetoin utilization protein AcuB